MSRSSGLYFFRLVIAFLCQGRPFLVFYTVCFMHELYQVLSFLVQKRNEKKEASEKKYYENKTYISE
jgi:hypothetical protein